MMNIDPVLPYNHCFNHCIHQAIIMIVFKILCISSIIHNAFYFTIIFQSYDLLKIHVKRKLIINTYLFSKPLNRERKKIDVCIGDYLTLSLAIRLMESKRVFNYCRGLY